MKRNTLVIILSVLVLPPASRAQQPGVFTFDHMLERHDQNRDGKIAAKEFQGAPQIFARFDLNKDAIIEQKEYEKVLKHIQERKKNTWRKPKPMKAPEGVTAHHDLEYAIEDNESLQLDLYMPTQTTAIPPLVVWIHGGGWKTGDKSNVNPAILRLSADGYAVAGINYRLRDLTIHPKNIHDCKGALRWLRANAENYGYSAEQIAVGGGSAGGHLSLLLGLSAGVDELEGAVGGHTNQSSSVKAVIDLYGPSDLVAFSLMSPRFNNAHEFFEEQLKHASPLTYLDKTDPPVLIFHGDNDKTVPVEQSRLVHKKYQEIGLESHLNVLEGSGHGGKEFSDDTRYQQIKSFLDKHLKTN